MSEHTREELKRLQELPMEQKVLVTQTRIIEWYQHWMGSIYVSFSGGKDSTVLLHIARQIFPEIPAVFINTGFEYPQVRKFALAQENVREIRPRDGERPIAFRDTILKYGYPLISKAVSNVIVEARRTIGGSRWKRLHGEYKSREDGKKSQFDHSKYLPLYSLPIRISDECCKATKKTPVKKYERSSNEKPIVGTTTDESVLRMSAWLKTGCNAFDAARPMSKPLSFWTNQDILQYIVKFNVDISPIYGDVVCADKDQLMCSGAQRTGCSCCPLGAHLEKEETRFQMLKRIEPKMYEYAMGGGEWIANDRYDPTKDSKLWNPRTIWAPNKKGLGLAKVFDMVNDIYGKDFYRYE